LRRNGRQDRTPAIAVLTRMAGRGLLTETAIDLRGKHRETWSSACFLGRFARLLAETYRLSGKVWVSTIADMKVTGYWGPPKVRRLFETIYFAGLRQLGVLEE
jgi:hypothetical protein